MKKSFAVLTAATALAIYAGMRAYSHAPDAGDGQIPLPPGYAETPAEYSADELKMIDALAYKCAKEGIINMNNEIKDGDGDKCIIALCGEKAAYAELPEASKLLRECYEKNAN